MPASSGGEETRRLLVDPATREFAECGALRAERLSLATSFNLRAG